MTLSDIKPSFLFQTYHFDKYIERAWYIPPTRGRESLCLPSPRAVPRGALRERSEQAPRGTARGEGKHRLSRPLVGGTSFFFIMSFLSKLKGMFMLSPADLKGMIIPSLSARESMKPLKHRKSMNFFYKNIKLIIFIFRETTTMIFGIKNFQRFPFKVTL